MAAKAGPRVCWELGSPPGRASFALKLFAGVGRVSSAGRELSKRQFGVNQGKWGAEEPKGGVGDSAWAPGRLRSGCSHAPGTLCVSTQLLDLCLPPHTAPAACRPRPCGLSVWATVSLVWAGDSRGRALSATPRGGFAGKKQKQKHTSPSRKTRLGWGKLWGWEGVCFTNAAA